MTYDRNQTFPKVLDTSYSGTVIPGVGIGSVNTLVKTTTHLIKDFLVDTVTVLTATQNTVTYPVIVTVDIVNGRGNENDRSQVVVNGFGH